MGTPFPRANGAMEPSVVDLPRVLDIEIDPPIEWNGNTYSVLHLEEPTGKMVVKAEQELANGANFSALRNYQFALVSNCSNTPRAVVEQMRISQIQEAASFLSSFMPGGLGTGGN
jgi:hypothetical protein